MAICRIVTRELANQGTLWTPNRVHDTYWSARLIVTTLKSLWFSTANVGILNTVECRRSPGGPSLGRLWDPIPQGLGGFHWMCCIRLAKEERERTWKITQEVWGLGLKVSHITSPRTASTRGIRTRPQLEEGSWKMQSFCVCSGRTLWFEDTDGQNTVAATVGLHSSLLAMFLWQERNLAQF